MKKFILKLLIMTFIIGLFNIFLYQFSKAIYFKDYYKIPSKRYHIFLFSDSRGLPLDTLPQKYKVYNFTAPSESYFDIYRKISFLLENKYQIDKIYLSVDDHTLSQYREYTNNMDRSFLFEKASFKNKFFPILNPNITALLKSYIKTKITEIGLNNHTISKIKRWDLIDIKSQKNEVLFRKHSQFPTKKASAKLKKSLIQIIKICKINNIELIGFKYPLSKIYLENITDRNYGADKIFKIKKLNVLDFSRIYLKKNHFFENQDHLNYHGGVHFNNILFSNLK